MIAAEVRREALALAELPTIPEVVVRIVRTLEDPGTSASDLGAVIESDPAVTTRVLRLANSAYFGRGRDVDSVRRAVVVIGFEGVRLLALATSVVDMLAGISQGVLDAHDFWLHSFGTAISTQAVERRLGAVTNDRGLRFATGLLHDIGKYPLAAAYGARYGNLLATAASTARSVAEVELEWLGTTHAEVAAWMMRRWRFPEALATLTAQLPDRDAYCGPQRRDLAIVALAEELARVTEFGSAGDAPLAAPDPRLVDELLLGDELAALRTELAAAREHTAQMLSDWQKG